MKPLLYSLIGLAIFSSCGNNTGEKQDVTRTDSITAAAKPDSVSDASLVDKSEAMKASIETMAPSLVRQEIVLKNSTASAAIKQKWMKMDVYRDSAGAVRRIKLYPHSGISERGEEFYYDHEQMFFVFIADVDKKEMENHDEGQPGKEFHFAGNRLVKYDDKSGDKETNEAEERSMYETSLPLEAKEFLALAKTK